ncbi:MAG: hypothetical protein KGI98_16970 [Euryarchaeota archaeon]|nr:hypothetical protein [Euryarchaeota archaeon]MDE1881835.1 hypothetical protein [Euryarchaeota archaeon]
MPDEVEVGVSIKFSAPWDKLNDRRFSTIRSWTASKERYYAGLIGKSFKVVQGEAAGTNDRFLINRKDRGRAVLRHVIVCVPSEMDRTELMRDVLLDGKPSDLWMNRLLAMPKALLLEFVRDP